MKHTTARQQEMNGWPNWFTWNVALWLNGDEQLYNLTVEYRTMKERMGGAITYDGFLRFAEIPRGTKTPDGAAFWSPNVNREAMRELLLES